MSDALTQRFADFLCGNVGVDVTLLVQEFERANPALTHEQLHEGIELAVTQLSNEAQAEFGEVANER